MVPTSAAARNRYARIARRSAIAALAALIAVCAALLLLHGPLRQFAGALIGICIVTFIGAQAVFFWALLRGRLYRRASRRGD